MLPPLVGAMVGSGEAMSDSGAAISGSGAVMTGSRAAIVHISISCAQHSSKFSLEA